MAAVRVALDAMGGDHAPAAAVAGALEAVADGLDVVLVGDELRLADALGEAAVPVVHAPEWIMMDEDPAVALRTKRQASVRVAAQLVADGEAAAFVSAGPTGATLAAGLLTLGRAPGVRRPAVAAVLPLEEGRSAVLIDAGANADASAEVVAAFATMGVAYAEVLGVATPRVGLLNTGAEPGKGNALAREVHDLLAARDDFIGNLEPAAVIAGAADVVVGDGFTGNVFLKTVEACGGADRDGHAGAAVLLGVNGEVLVAHGAADAAEIARALRTAEQVASAGLAARVGERLAARKQQDE